MGRASGAKRVVADWWARPRVRLVVLIPLWIATYGVGAVFWHLALGHTWGDAIAFAACMGVGQWAVQWWYARSQQRKQRTGQGPE